MKFSNGFMEDDLVPAFLPDTIGEFAENRSGGVQAPVLEELMLDTMKFPRFSNGETDLDLLPFEGLQSLCSALSSRTGSRGRLTLTKCYVGLDDPLRYDMVGQWESGHFYVVSAECYEF